MRYRLKQDAVVWQSVDGEVVYLDLAASEYRSVNASGSVLWRAIADGADREALVAALHTAFEIDNELASADVEVFLDELDQQGLLVTG